MTVGNSERIDGSSPSLLGWSLAWELLWRKARNCVILSLKGSQIDSKYWLGKRTSLLTVTVGSRAISGYQNKGNLEKPNSKGIMNA